ncbi:MAG TPA: MFS transporter [Panacibacter sp.]|nr:MFS transporter [Panacibacter sp.]HNP42643.1 MFS transporter [Panacibacter sp.]
MDIISNRKLYTVIGASSLGTLIEWYDFYIFGSLATIISEKFFPPGNPTAAFLATLATFAAGFIVRPFGALFFGRLGDLIGRKHTFLLTLIIMGGSTFLIGLVPSYESFSLAPAVILLLRLLQGLALGGEYGGAATYVAEHAPANRRGYFTSWIQTTATLGLFVSLIVIITCQQTLSKEAYNDWGWRLPFLLSVVLVAFSIVVRLKMSESPLFSKLKKEGKTSVNPLKESFGHKTNLKMVLLALFGATMGQGVVWYTSQFYAQTFLLKTCNIDATQANTWMGIGLLIGTPFFVIFGSLSDKIGRKFIMLAGMLIALLSYRYIFTQFYNYADIKQKTEIVDKTTVNVTRAADKAKPQDSVITTTTNKSFTDGSSYLEVKKETILADKSTTAPKPSIKKTVTLSDSYQWKVIGFVFILVIFVTMVYGPIAAFLVELFPTQIRYTSMSLPYHIGNGVFGGLVPFIGTLLYEYSKTPANPPGDVLAGLSYPIAIAAVCFIIGALYLSNKQQKQAITD